MKSILRSLLAVLLGAFAAGIAILVGARLAAGRTGPRHWPMPA
jgi:hypothetical protein